jgi:hypothetical protein
MIFLNKSNDKLVFIPLKKSWGESLEIGIYCVSFSSRNKRGQGVIETCFTN